jgi:GH18 family chitinase
MVLEETRQYWKANNKEYILTAATPGLLFAGSATAWKRIATAADYLLAMKYEYQHTKVRTRGGAPLYAGNGDDETEQQNNVQFGASQFLNVGVPKEKLVIGFPLYGVGWTGLNPNMQFRDNIPGFGAQIGNSLLPTNPTAYNTLMDEFSKNSNWKGVFDEKRVTHVYYNGTTVWFMESTQTVAAKARYVKENSFAGIMLWNSNQDLKESGRSLLNAINKEYPIDTNVNKRSAKYCVDSSSFCNIKCDYQPIAGTVGFDAAGSGSGSNSAVGNSNGGPTIGKATNGNKQSQSSASLSIGSICALALTVLAYLSS